MYRYSNGQISLSDFKQPVGMHLKENIWWVKKYRLFPDQRLKKRYAALFTNRKGHVTIPLWLALGVCIIQAMGIRTWRSRSRYRKIHICSTLAGIRDMTIKATF